MNETDYDQFAELLEKIIHAQKPVSEKWTDLQYELDKRNAWSDFLELLSWFEDEME